MNFYKYYRSLTRSFELIHLVYFLVLFIIISYCYNLTKSDNEGSFFSSEEAAINDFIKKFNFTAMPKDTSQNNEKLIVLLFNKMGSMNEFTVFDMNTVTDEAFVTNLQGSGLDEQTVKFILTELYRAYNRIENNQRIRSNTRKGIKRSSTRINVGTTSCWTRPEDVNVLLKSVALFSQDAALHIILFSDKDTILTSCIKLLELKWTVNSMGWDLTYEIHSNWFPGGQFSEWSQIYSPCGSQRLFFPSLLPHIESLIYLDSDTLVVSNLTEFWMKFSLEMGNGEIAALSIHNEPWVEGWYNMLENNTKIPFYGKWGLNAGVMLMNLTEMRRFGFQNKSVMIHNVYQDKIQLADQDIINIFFAEVPDKLAIFDCTYNFNWVHCGGDSTIKCDLNGTYGTNKCFCNALVQAGARIIHGNGGTFFSKRPDYLFLGQVYTAFEKLDFLSDSYLTMFADLREEFNSLDESPCIPLTADQLYRNGEAYLRALKST